MARKYYETKVVGVGGDVQKFIKVVKMIVLFDDSMVLPELREFSILHSGNKLNEAVKVGDIIKIADEEFKIIKVGSEVYSNMCTLGHVVIKFDGGAGDLMESSIHVEDKPIPDIKIGDTISIKDTTADILMDKKIYIDGADNETVIAMKKIFLDNGAILTDKDDSDIIVTVK